MHQLITKQQLPISLEEAWEFFSSPRNLEEITPTDMRFIITNMPEGRMYPGMIIMYKVSPLFGIKLKWMTEITHVEEGSFFIDNQKAGPFKIWHHQHHFRKTEGGVEMTDIVTYAAPFGILGRLAEKLTVHKRVRQIFDYRKDILEERFGRME
jgi:ligand-binding SRPBCC domain-containing protein